MEVGREKFLTKKPSQDYHSRSVQCFPQKTLPKTCYVQRGRDSMSPSLSRMWKSSIPCWRPVTTSSPDAVNRVSVQNKNPNAGRNGLGLIQPRFTDARRVNLTS